VQKKIKELLNRKEVTFLQKVLGTDADLHIVGGAVRDLFLEKDPKDIDLATKLTPQKVISKLEKNKVRYVPLGIRRGTIAAIVDHQSIEITTFRNPQQEDVFTDSIEQDLPARDFTINAIAISVNTGKLIDPFGGEQDLKKGILKTVGDPTLRFTEDPHRILRLIRFGTGHGRVVEKATLEAAKKLSHLLQHEKVERIGMEFSKIMMLPTTSNCLREMNELGILSIVLPELIPCVGLEQNQHHKLDVFEHTLSVVDNVEDYDNLKLKLAALFHDIGKPESITEVNGRRRMIGHELVSERIAKEAMTRLKYSNFMVECVTTLVRLHMKPIIGMKSGGIRRLIRDAGFLLEDWMALKKADILGGRNLDYDFEPTWKEFVDRVDYELYRTDVAAPKDPLEIGGKDIMSLGIPQGPVVGQVLALLREEVLEDPTLNKRDVLLVRAAEIAEKQL